VNDTISLGVITKIKFTLVDVKFSTMISTLGFTCPSDSSLFLITSVAVFTFAGSQIAPFCRSRFSFCKAFNITASSPSRSPSNLSVFQRIVDLGPGHRRPLPNLSILKGGVHFIAMRRALSQQAQDHQIGVVSRIPLGVGSPSVFPQLSS
jgi:hypothetical protein